MRIAVALFATAALTGCYKIAGGTVYDQQSQRFFGFKEDTWANVNEALCPDGFELGPKVQAPPRRRDTRQVWVSRGTQEIPMGWRSYSRATFYECKEPGKDA